MTDAAVVHAVRQACWANRYRPVAIYSPGARLRDGTPIKGAGKRPVTNDWLALALRDPPDAVVRAASTLAGNTGLITGQVSACDVDVLIPEIVDKIVSRIESTLGPTPLCRIGRPPKILLCYRAVEDPFAKLSTATYCMPDGSLAHFEILGQGQQFVAFGTHPETLAPYRWLDRSPVDVPLDELPAITPMQARDLIGEAEAILLTAGGVVQPRTDTGPKDPPHPADPPGSSSDHDGFFRAVNTAALGNIAAWAPALHSDFRDRSNSGWRLSSKDLGRDLEEDIAVHPDGIRDFGEEITLTAIDLIIRLGGAADARKGAFWLCERLGVTPESLGWRGRTTPKDIELPGGGGGNEPPRLAGPGPGTGPEPRDDPPVVEGEGVALEDFYAYMPQHNYVFAPARELWPAASVNARIEPIQVGTNKKGEPVFISAALWLDQNRPVEQMTWAPGMPMIIKNRLIAEGGWIKRNKVSCFNLYRSPLLTGGDPTQAGRWIALVDTVYPENANHIRDWLAHRVQRPEDKVNHALVLGGPPGIGKDSMIEPVKRAVGPWNFAEPSPQQLMGRFNGYARSVILRISEARDLGDFDRFQFYEHLKIYIAAPPDVIRIDEKHLREYNAVNCCGVLITTNHKTDGLYLPADDRRHYVTWSTLVKEDFPPDYWNDLWHWYNHGGDRHVAAYLATLDLSGFNPKAPPPKTEAFWTMVNSNRAPEDAELADVLEALGEPDAVTLMQVIVKAQEEKLHDFGDWLRDRKNRRIVLHRFEACGYVPIRNPDANDGLWKIRGRRQVVYTKAGLTIADQLRAARSV